MRGRLICLCVLYAILLGPSGAEELRTLAILANFPDAVSDVTREEIDRFFNADDYQRPGASRSVRQWTHEVSHGRVQINATVTDWITLPHDARHYKDLGFYDGPPVLALDAIQTLESTGFDFSPYDNNGDGVIEMVGIIYRGPEGPFGTGDGPAWTQAPPLYPEVNVDGVSIRHAYVAWDWFPAFESMIDLAAITHEGLWHVLGGLPDVFDYQPSWWNSAGIELPSHFSAHGKLKLGWIDVIDLETPGPVSIAAIDASATAFRLWIDPYREHEYFLLENRRPLGADANLPGAGLLIWHVDESAGQTEYLRLEEADGNNKLEIPTGGFGFGAAESGDPFPGSTANTAFNDFTTPAGLDRANQATGIRVDAIAMNGDAVEATITPSPNLLGFTLAHDHTYPGFQWLWAPDENGPRDGEHMAVRFTTPVDAELRRVRFPIVTPGDTTVEISVHRDFEASMTLSAPPLYRGSDTAQGDFVWNTHELATPVGFSGGESFVVDLVFSEPTPTVDYWDAPDGHSFYWAPGDAQYRPIPFDLRIRANMVPVQRNTATRWRVYF